MVDPLPFGAGGIWAFVQVVTPNDVLLTTAGQTSSVTQGGLDGQFPYYGHTYSTDGVKHTDSDCPGYTLPGTLAGLNVTESFQTTIMYCPPSTASAPANVPAVQWVPFKQLTWSWSSKQTQPYSNTQGWLGWAIVNPAGTASALCVYNRLYSSLQ